MIKKIIWASLIACIFLLPFLTADVFEAGTYFLYAAFSLILCQLAVSNKTYLKNRKILTPLFIWLFIIFLTSIYSLHKEAAFEAMASILICALAFIVLSGLDGKRKRQIGLTVAAGSFFISLLAIWQYFFFFNDIMPSLVSQDPSLTQKEFLYLSDLIQRKRVTSVFAIPNLFASYLSMVNIIIVSFCFIYKKMALRGLFWLLLIINCYALWLTRSIGGLLSFTLGIILFIIFFSIRNKFKQISRKRLLIFLGASLLILFIILLVKRLFYDAGTDNLQISLRGRLEFWQTAFKIIKDRPLQFTGLGGLKNLYRLYSPQAKLESEMVHNLFLQLWIETGIHGLLAFIWFLSAFIYKGLKKIFGSNTSSQSYLFQAAALAAILAFLFHNLLDFSFFVTQTAIIWWLLGSFVIGNKREVNGY